MKKLSATNRAMLAALIAFSIFGLSYLFSKMALRVAEPMILLFVRFFVTVIILDLLVLCRFGKLSLRGKPLGAAMLVGILQPVLYFILENYGLKYTTTSFTGIVASVSPIFTTLLGILFLKEYPNVRQWIFISVSIVGVLLVSVGGTGGANTWYGCLCLLAAYLVGSLYTVAIRRMSETFTTFELTFVMFHVGFLFFAVLAFLQYGGNMLPMVGAALSEPTFIPAVLYLGGLSSVGAYMLVNFSLAHLPVSRSNIFSCFATVVSVLSGIIIMGDPFTPVSLISMILILVGVYGVNRFAAQEET